MAKKQFEYNQKQVIDEVRFSISAHEKVFRGGLGLFLASNFVDRTEWKSYVDALDLDSLFPSVKSLSYIRLVSNTNEQTYIEDKKKEGFKDFKIFPEKSSKILAPATYIEPFNMQGKSLHGFDFYSIEPFRKAMEFSRDSGKTTIAHPLDPEVLPWSQQHQSHYVMFIPHYSENQRLFRSVVERRKAIQGFIFGVFDINTVLNIIRSTKTPQVEIKIFDGEKNEEEEPICVSQSEEAIKLEQEKGNRVFPKMSSSRVITLGNHAWTIHFSTYPKFGDNIDKSKSIFVLIFGAFIAFLAFITLRSLSSSKRKAEQIAEEKTKALRENEEQLTSVLNNAGEGIFGLDIDGYTTFCNKAAEELLGYDLEELREEKQHEIIHHHHEDGNVYPIEDSKIYQTLKDGLVRHEEQEVFWTKHDGPIPVEYTSAPIKDDEGNITGAVVVFRDISEVLAAKKELEKHRDNLAVLVEEQTTDLERAKEKAEKASRAKDDFLANMSHELRTPLNSILGLTKIMLEEENLQEDVYESLSIVDKASDNLLQIVNNILDLSKIEAEAIELEYRPFSIYSVLHSVVDQIRPLASQKGLDFSNNLANLEDIDIAGDQYRLTRVLMNLLSNAIKFTPSGSITVYAETSRVDYNTLEFICRVQDTGVGIPKDKLKRIFEKFTQAEESTERTFGGSGLGLSITKHLVEMMKGSVNVESEENEGSIFSICIPFDVIHTKKTEESTSSNASEHIIDFVNERKPIKQSRILIAEDHEFNQIFIGKLVKRIGCDDFKIADSGQSALELFEKEHFDLILMDCHMPIMNGYETSVKIRELEKERRHNKTQKSAANSKESVSRTPIIAITADIMAGTREKCISSGMDDYISKPIDEAHLRNLVQNWFMLEHDYQDDAVSNQNTNKKNQTAESQTTDKEENKPDASEKTSSSKDSKKQNAADVHIKNTLVDLSILKDYANNDWETEKRLVKTFHKNSIEDIEKLRGRYNTESHTQWYQAAHHLKGSTAYLGAHRLHKLCEDAQNMSEDAANDKVNIFSEIEKEHEKLCNYLKDLGYLES